jgi:hypothetical protein
MNTTDFIGMIGVVMVTCSYLLLHLEHVTRESNVYLAANSIGAILIMISLWYDWNLCEFIMEVIWLAISILGIVKKINS